MNSAARLPGFNWKHHLRSLALVLMVVLGVNLWQSRHVPAGTAPLPSAPMTSAAGVRQEARNQDLQAWLQAHHGQVVAVHFWATWCPICDLSADNITQLQSWGWPVVTVAMQSGDAAAIESHLRDKELPWLAAVDDQTRIAQAWGVQAVPASVIIDEHGQIASASMGYTSTLGLLARLLWTEALSH